MHKTKAKLDMRFIAIGAIFIIALYVLLPQVGDFKASRHMLSHPEIPWLLAAIAFVSLTYISAGGTYYFLAFRKLKYGRTVLVELAAMFINRLLPGGVGALGANYIYLKRNHSNAGQAGTIVAINNTLGFVGHSLLALIILAIYSGHTVSLNKHEANSWNSIIKYVVAVLAIGAVALLIFGRKRIRKFMAGIGQQLMSYKKQPWKLVVALLTSMTLTLFNVACLFACMQSIGGDLSFFAVFLIFSFGVSAGTATPTPGGLGGYEAALTAGFVAYGMEGPMALAIALLYRLVSYWLPLLVGSVAFFFSQKRRYI
jgi:undecaprenyl-diphosphatase